MKTISLEQIGIALKEKRGNRGIREAAKDIGISPATLSRIETGKQPDLDTFTKVCRWLNVNPADVLNFATKNTDNNDSINNPLFTQSFSVQFRAEKNFSPLTANKLGEMIMAVQNMNINESK